MQFILKQFLNEFLIYHRKMGPSEGNSCTDSLILKISFSFKKVLRVEISVCYLCNLPQIVTTCWQACICGTV